jgi:hypothetical protein
MVVCVKLDCSLLQETKTDAKIEITTRLDNVIA